ncbi:hypothetical protein LUZ60_009033 [Juncus effusus]|nr:hypothetical protein LUZ60_009033 [Juncus effusus]
MADVAVLLVVGRLRDLAFEEYHLQTDMSNQITLLRDKLEWLQTFIRDADQKRRHQGNYFVAVWVRQTREVAFEVEDALDEFLIEAGAEYEGRLRQLGCFALLWRGPHIFRRRHRLAGRIEVLNKRLDEILSNKDKYNIADDALIAWRAWAPSRTELSNSWLAPMN